MTGSSTAFVTFFKAGHLIRAGGQVRTVFEVISDTSLTTEAAFNPAVSGVAYERVGAKPTLDEWRSANGFAAGDDADAVYLNAGDLGLGRWMHVKRNTTTGDLAYYVSNYGVPPNLGSADLAAFAKLNNNPGIGL
ncbi:MAG TPA: hypothetical protein VE466_17025, partial [Acidimicrobiales bacterium]|nr:hypothetical protein [Acidimicrobiales bacterium]